MHAGLILAILVAMGQVGEAESRYDIPRFQAEGETSIPQQPSDYSPVTPANEPASSEGEQPPASDTITSAEVKPSDLWKSLSSEPTKERLGGFPITLAEAVAGATSRGEQTARVVAYWDLAAAAADYYLALRESTELEALRQGIQRPSFAWDEARLALSSRVQAARTSAEVAQHRLQRLLRNAPDGELPLPSDRPHCGAYETRYEENFAGRDSAEALQLSELLPQLHQELRNDTARVSADQEALQAASQRRDPQSDGSELLQAYELFSLRRREFVRDARNYNVQIARYTELATPGQVGTGRLVAMLIGTPPGQAAAGNNSGITRTSAEEPLDSPQQPRTTPRTFAEEAPPATQRKPLVEQGQERSILVRPQ